MLLRIEHYDIEAVAYIPITDTEAKAFEAFDVFLAGEPNAGVIEDGNPWSHARLAIEKLCDHYAERAMKSVGIDGGWHWDLPLAKEGDLP